MDSNSNSSSSSGISFFGLLTIVFIVLKLTGCIAWSWWWVLAPIWMPFLIILLIVGIIFLINKIINKKREKALIDIRYNNIKTKK